MIQRIPSIPEITPIGNRVLVEVTQAAELKTEGGIILPQEAIRNDAKEAIVAAFDDSLVDINDTGITRHITLGSKVVLRKYVSQAIHYAGREFRIVDAKEDILAVIPNDLNASFTVNTR